MQTRPLAPLHKLSLLPRAALSRQRPSAVRDAALLPACVDAWELLTCLPAAWCAGRVVLPSSHPGPPRLASVPASAAPSTPWDASACNSGKRGPSSLTCSACRPCIPVPYCYSPSPFQVARADQVMDHGRPGQGQAAADRCTKEDRGRHGALQGLRKGDQDKGLFKGCSSPARRRLLHCQLNFSFVPLDRGEQFTPRRRTRKSP